MKYKALLLDFYGTLAREDDEPYEQVLQRICRTSPSGPVAEDVEREWTRRFTSLCDSSRGEGFLTQRKVSRESLNDLSVHFQAPIPDIEVACNLLFERCWQHPSAFEDVPEFLARLTLPTCIVSNVDEEDVRAALAHLGWCFEHIVTSEGCRAYKPRPEMFQRALSLLDVAAGEALHVGDSFSSDVVGALGVGIDVVWLNRRCRPIPPGGPQPTYVASSLREVAKVLGLRDTR